MSDELLPPPPDDGGELDQDEHDRILTLFNEIHGGDDDDQ